MTRWLAGLPTAGQALAALGGAASMGFAAGLASLALVQLPDQVRNNTAAIVRLQQEIETVIQQARLANCMAIAERANTDWRQCLTPHSRELPE